jgi:hypothetical protein
MNRRHLLAEFCEVVDRLARLEQRIENLEEVFILQGIPLDGPCSRQGGCTCPPADDGDEYENGLWRSEIVAALKGMAPPPPPAPPPLRQEEGG